MTGYLPSQELDTGCGLLSRVSVEEGIKVKLAPFAGRHLPFPLTECKPHLRLAMHPQCPMTVPPTLLLL